MHSRTLTNRAAAIAAAFAITIGAVAAVFVGPMRAEASVDGSLTWAVNSDFRGYVLGAGGTVTAGGSASDNGSTTTFPASASTLDAQGNGQADYAGSVTFNAHGGALNIVIDAPQIRFGSATTAVVSALVNGSRIDLVTADLRTATVSAGATTVTFSGAQTTLTSAGSTAFGGVYQAGQAMAPLTFSFPTAPAAEPSPTASASPSAEPSATPTDASPTPSATAEPTPTPAGPRITVDRTTGLDGTGDTVTVTGTGFLPDANGATTGTRPPLAGKFTGVYVVFGKFADVWQPSDGAARGTRTAETTRWALPAADMATVGGSAAGAIELSADGSFTVEVPVSDALANAGNWGIYTYAAGGSVYEPFETFTPVTFAPRVVVTPSGALDADGTTITVTGKHFTPNAPATTGTRPPLAGKFTGVYVAFGRYAEVWEPSAGAPRAARANADTRWLVNPEDVATIGGAAAGGVAIGADGSFTVELNAAEGFTGDSGTGNYGVVTYPGGGAVYAPFETFTAVTFAEPEPSPSAEPSTPPTAPATPATVGRLTWGIDADFRAYITGAIARGSITVSGASASAQSFTFVQSGGSADVAAGSGRATYSGSVRFTGHAGALDLTFANPSVRLTSASSAVLELSVNGSRVDFATLNLAAGSRSTSGDAVRFTGVPATLTSAGASAFNGFYAAGRQLDPVTVTFGAGTTARGSGITVFSAETDAAPPATPPATTGIELDDSALASLLAGDKVTITVGGFQPGETGIRVVLYSSPLVLAEGLTADSSGTVTWTGSLPKGTSGSHTLTFQGSVAKGIEFTVPLTVAGACSIDDAGIAWGFKESFRAYIESTVANGGWELSEGASEQGGIFAWTFAAGGTDEVASADDVNAELAFTGQVHFTGHDGALSTAIANPRIVIDGDAATVFMDVTGTTQDGLAVVATGVEFASVDLSAASRSQDGTVVTFSDAPAVLTEAGAAAFGTYPAGEALDPITITVDLGNCAAAPVEEEQLTATAERPAEEPADGGTPAWVWAVLAAVVLAGAALAVWRVKGRKRDCCK